MKNLISLMLKFLSYFNVYAMAEKGIANAAAHFLAWDWRQLKKHRWPQECKALDQNKQDDRN